MDKEEKIKRLKKECGFWDSTARSYVEFDGKCAYCSVDLIDDRRNYAYGKIDHLLPKSIYPVYISDQRNLILACDLCNSLKGQENPCHEGENPEEMLESKRDELIRRAKTIIDNNDQKARLMWGQAKDILHPDK